MNVFQNPGTIPLGTNQAHQNNNLNAGVKNTELTQKNNDNQKYDYLFQGNNNPTSNSLNDLQTNNITIHESIEPNVPSDTLPPINPVQGKNDSSLLNNAELVTTSYQLSNIEKNELINFVNTQNQNNNNKGVNVNENKNISQILTQTLNSPQQDIQPKKFESKATQTEDADLLKTGMNKNTENIDWLLNLPQTQTQTTVVNNDWSNVQQIQNIQNSEILTSPQIPNGNITTTPPQNQFTQTITYPGPGQTPIIEIDTSSIPSQNYINQNNTELSISNPLPSLQSTPAIQTNSTLSVNNNNILNSNILGTNSQFGEYTISSKSVEETSFTPSVSVNSYSTPSVVVNPPQKKIIKIPKVRKVVIPRVKRIIVPSKKKVYVMRRTNSEIPIMTSRLSINNSITPIIGQSLIPITPQSMPYTIAQPLLAYNPVPSIANLPQVSQISPIMSQMQFVPNVSPLLSQVPSAPNLFAQRYQYQPLVNPISLPQYSTASYNPIMLPNNNNIIAGYNNISSIRSSFANNIAGYNTSAYRSSFDTNLGLNPPIKYSSKTYNARKLKWKY